MARVDQGLLAFAVFATVAALGILASGVVR